MATHSLVAPTLAQPQSLDLRVVALTGQPAPGTNGEAVFNLFGPFVHDPTISAGPTIGFAAFLSDFSSGLWIDDGSEARLLARTGNPAPGVGLRATFALLPFSIAPVPPLVAPGHAVFRGVATGDAISFDNDEGIWRTSGPGLELVVREDAPAPGLPGVRFSQMIPSALDSAGRVLFSAQLRGAVTASNDESIWRAAPGAVPELVAREGAPAPGVGQGATFALGDHAASAFSFAAGNGAGDLLFQGALSGPGVHSGNDDVMFIRDAAGTRPFIREGDPVPGIAGATFDRVFGSFFTTAFNVNARAAVLVPIRRDGTSLPALLSNVGGALEPLAVAGDPAPGTDGQFRVLINPVMNTRGDIAFMGKTDGAPEAPIGLWVHSSGQLRPVVLPGRQVQGQPQGTLLVSLEWIIGISDAGFIPFRAHVALPGGGFASELLFADPAGDIGLIARLGDRFDLAEDDARTVSEIFALPGPVTTDSHAAFGLRFTDGSAAYVHASFRDGTPACPADINLDGAVDSQDFFEFLRLFFALNPGADFDGDGSVNSQDFFTFLAALFEGC